MTFPPVRPSAKHIGDHPGELARWVITTHPAPINAGSTDGVDGLAALITADRHHRKREKTDEGSSISTIAR